MTLRKALAIAGLIASTSASADQIQFNFIYGDSATTGFNDPVLGAQRKAALQTAGAYWSGLLPASYAGETINIAVNFNSASTAITPLSGTSANDMYANAGMNGVGISNIAYAAPLAEYLQGKNLNGNNPDFTLSFNPNPPTYLGLDGNTPAGQYDFVSVGIRAIARTLAFNSRVDKDPADSTPGMGGFITTWGRINDVWTNFGNLPTIYDSMIVQKLSDGSFVSLLNMTDSQRIAAVSSGQLYWNGANGIAANGGVRPMLFAPAYSGSGAINGNAIVYFDPSQISLMTTQYPPVGTSMQADAITIGVMKDVGWNIAAVPEPSGYAMLLAGMGLLGFMARRRS